MTDDFDIDIDDFLKKYDTTVKIVSLSAASNVTGTIFDLVKIKKMIKADTLFIVDGSQLLGKKVVDVKKWDCDIMIATAHKMFALTWLGMVYMRKSLIKELQPTRGGGGVIEDVDTHGFQLTYGSEKREPGTPNIIWAVSLSAAIDYINNIWLETIQHHDQQLIAHF